MYLKNDSGLIWDEKISGINLFILMMALAVHAAKQRYSLENYSALHWRKTIDESRKSSTYFRASRKGKSGFPPSDCIALISTSKTRLRTPYRFSCFASLIHEYCDRTNYCRRCARDENPYTVHIRMNCPSDGIDHADLWYVVPL